MEEIKEVRKEILFGMKDLLKPYGFRKKGDRYRRLLDSGILWELRIPEDNFKGLRFQHFTVQINLGIFPAGAEKDIWEPQDLPIEGELGQALAKGWQDGKWYTLLPLIFPGMGAQIVNEQFPITYKEPDQGWQTKWVPCPSPARIMEEAFQLVRDEVIPFFFSVQTPGQYLALLKDPGKFVCIMGLEHAKVYAELFGPGFLPILEKWITLQEKSLKRVMEYDLSRLDPASAQLHRSSAQSMEKVLQEYQALQKQLQEAGSL